LPQLKILDLQGNVLVKNTHDFYKTTYSYFPSLVELNPLQIIRLSQFVDLAINEVEPSNEFEGYGISQIAFTLPYAK
jgi:hypothetical protein